MERQPNILVFETPEQLALAAAERFVDYFNELRDVTESFTVTSQEGTRRAEFMNCLPPSGSRVESSGLRLISFGDERRVPPEHPDSNYAMAYEALISRVPIPAKNVHRIIGEGNANENALAYENQLASLLRRISLAAF